jgi:hypothetical protein
MQNYSQKNCKKKSGKEIKEYVAKKLEERKTIQNKISELDTKRSKFMTKKNLKHLKKKCSIM